MAEFYVNEIGWRNSVIPDAPNNQDNVGLFTYSGYEGRGNFCGWYATEYYLDAKLYAYYQSEGGSGCLYSPDKRISDVTVFDPPIHFDEVRIGSGYWERIIEAETIEEAIEKFKRAEWGR